jgi:hypothetical protein
MVPSRIRSLRLFAFVAFVTVLHCGATRAQTARPSHSGAFTDIKWDVYTFRFLPGNQMGQVLDTKGQVVATILSMSGGLQLMPTVTGPDTRTN